MSDELALTGTDPVSGETFNFYRHEDGRRTLEMIRETPKGTLRRSVGWATPPNQELIAKAMQSMREIDEDKINADSGHSIIRKVMPLGLGTLYLGHDWGPPLWRFPKVLRKFSRQRVELGIGWRLHAYRVSWEPAE